MAGAEPTTNGESKWRMQAAEREINALRSDVNGLLTNLAVLKTVTEEHIRTTRERWREEDVRREAREKEEEKREALRDRRLEVTRRIAQGALAAFLAALIVALINLSILTGGPN